MRCSLFWCTDSMWDYRMSMRQWEFLPTRKDAAAAIDETRQSSSPSESSHKDRTRTRDKSRGETDRTISRTANRRSFSIDRLVKIQRATSSSSTPSSLSPSHHHDHHLIIINTGIIITLQTRPKPSHTTSPIYKTL